VQAPPPRLRLRGGGCLACAAAARAPRRSRLGLPRYSRGKQDSSRVASLPGIDCVMAAIVGAARASRHTRAARSRQRASPRKQGSAGGRGPRVHADRVRAGGAMLLPIDSEHNAIFQCLPPFAAGESRRKGNPQILLTGSADPFRRVRVRMYRVTAGRGLCASELGHGTQDIGGFGDHDEQGIGGHRSALAVRSGSWQIQVVVHPQSVVHSMSSTADGSVDRPARAPGMRTPTGPGASHIPRESDAGVPSRLLPHRGLGFEQPDLERFPALSLAYRCAQKRRRRPGHAQRGQRGSR